MKLTLNKVEFISARNDSFAKHTIETRFSKILSKLGLSLDFNSKIELFNHEVLSVGNASFLMNSILEEFKKKKMGQIL